MSINTPKELIDEELDSLYDYLEEKLQGYNFRYYNGMRPKMIGASYSFKDFIHDGEELTSLIRFDKDRTLTYVEDIDTVDTDYYLLQSYTDQVKDVLTCESIDLVLEQILGGLDESMEELNKYAKTLNEALENYHDERKWEALLQDLADCYEAGDHTQTYIEICKFFKYEDLLKTFLRLKAYRDRHNGYTFGDPEYQEQYDTFKIMMDRLESEIPNEEDYEAIRQFV